MEEYSYNQDPNYRPDINIEIAVGFNPLIAETKKTVRFGCLGQQKTFGIKK